MSLIMHISMPPTGRKRVAYDWGYSARQERVPFGNVLVAARGRYKSPAFQQAVIDGWHDADRKLWLDSMPTCSICHQPCVPPETEEEREGLDPHHPWHPDNGRKLPT